MQVVMTRVLLRARWMDKVCQGMFFVELYDNWRAPPEALQLLMEFRSQSQRLQDEMAGDIERLQDHLTEAERSIKFDPISSLSLDRHTMTGKSTISV
jgi:hypothetical protein